MPSMIKISISSLLLCVLLAACGSHDSQKESVAQQRKRPQRIVSLTPSATEVLHGIGAFGRVVAVSDYCNFPPETKNLPRVGGWQNTSLERVAALKPDLIVMTDAQAPFSKDRLEALGIETLAVPSRSLDDAFAAIKQIGKATGNDTEAARLANETRAKIEAVRERTATLARPRVLCIVDRVPGTLRDLYAATEGSFIAQLIEVAGGQAIASPAKAGYGRITKEAVVSLNPEIIIDMVQGAEGRLGEDPQAVWRELPQIEAVRAARIYPMRDASVLHPSQFVGSTAERFAEVIHPELFPQ
ncbi:MAG: ABC transporter substrate-binding protein [Pyrinomonadaceae bacterium]|nr:ABC transporter substrate-binding protein [Pyrinomonadaceae bacterium]